MSNIKSSIAWSAVGLICSMFVLAAIPLFTIGAIAVLTSQDDWFRDVSF